MNLRLRVSDYLTETGVNDHRKVPNLTTVNDRKPVSTAQTRHSTWQLAAEFPQAGSLTDAGTSLGQWAGSGAVSPTLVGLGLRVSEPLAWGTVPPHTTVDMGRVSLWGASWPPLVPGASPGWRP